MNQSQFNTHEGEKASVAGIATEEKSPSEIESQRLTQVTHDWATLQSAILQSAESECAGVTTRVTIADFQSIVNAVAKTLGVTKVARAMRLSPPTGLIRDCMEAAQRAASMGPQTSGGSAPTVGKQRAPLGGAASNSRPTPPRKAAAAKQLPGPSKSRGPRKAEPSPRREKKGMEGKGVSTKGSEDAPRTSMAEPRVRDPRKKILARALRSLSEAGPRAKLARELGLTEDSVKAKILGLTDKEIADRLASGVPALAYTGVFDDIAKVNWLSEYESDSWLASAHRRAVRGGPTIAITQDIPHFRVVSDAHTRDNVTPTSAASRLVNALMGNVGGAPGYKIPAGAFADAVRGARTIHYRVVHTPAAPNDPAQVKLTLRMYPDAAGVISTATKNLWFIAANGNHPHSSFHVSSIRGLTLPVGLATFPWTLPEEGPSGGSKRSSRISPEARNSSARPVPGRGHKVVQLHRQQGAAA